jgi:hypothetical protein
MGSVAGDFNEDGLLDLMVYFWGRPPVLYLRKSDGSAGSEAGQDASARPSEKPLALGAFVPRELIDSGERWYSNAAIQGDLDGDGHVDLFIGNYFQDGARVLDAKAGGTEVLHEGKAKALNGGYKHVFLWQAATNGPTPTVRYQEIKNVFSEEVARGWTLAMGAADLDGDLLPELYIANDLVPIACCTTARRLAICNLLCSKADAIS